MIPSQLEILLYFGWTKSLTFTRIFQLFKLLLVGYNADGSKQILKGNKTQNFVKTEYSCSDLT